MPRTDPTPSSAPAAPTEACARCGAQTGGACRERAAGLPVVSEAPGLDRDTRKREAPLSSGDLARACSTTVRTVRFYEEAGLVEPTSRSEGGHRLYAPEQVARLSLVIDLREAGLSLQDIKALFELKSHASGSLDASERMTALLHQRIDEMQAKIAVLRKLREELAAMETILRECGTCVSHDFPSRCAGCDVMRRPDLPRAMRLLWG